MTKTKLHRHCEQERLGSVAERSNLIIDTDCFGSLSPTQPRNDVKVKVVYNHLTYNLQKILTY